MVDVNCLEFAAVESVGTVESAAEAVIKAGMPGVVAV